MSAVAFSPGGKALAAWGASGAARLWDLTTHTQIGVPIPSGTVNTPPGSVNAMAFSPDGKTLATAGIDGKVRLWDAAATGRSPRP